MLYANILDTIKCENPTNIINNYLELTIKLIDKHKLNTKHDRKIDDDNDDDDWDDFDNCCEDCW